MRGGEGESVREERKPREGEREKREERQKKKKKGRTGEKTTSRRQSRTGEELRKETEIRYAAKAPNCSNLGARFMAAIQLFPDYKATVTTYQHKAVSGL